METDKYLDLWDKLKEVREEFDTILIEEGTITSINIDGVLEWMQDYLQRLHRKHRKEE